MSTFKLICMRCHRKLLYLTSCILIICFTDVPTNLIYKLKQEKCRTLRGVAGVFCLLLYSQSGKRLLFMAIISQVASYGSYAGLGCTVLGSCPKYFLNHHTLGNADKKQEAASFGLERVIFPVDFTLVFFFQAFKLYKLFNGFDFLTPGGFQSENTEVQNNKLSGLETHSVLPTNPRACTSISSMRCGTRPASPGADWPPCC